MLQNSPKEMKSFSFVVIFKLLTKEVAENLNQDFKIIYPNILRKWFLPVLIQCVSGSPPEDLRNLRSLRNLRTLLSMIRYAR